MIHVTKVAKVITKITAAPMPIAVEVFFDVPMKGQMPRNWAKITLLTNIVERMMMMYFIVVGYLDFLRWLTIAIT